MTCFQVKEKKGRTLVWFVIFRVGALHCELKTRRSKLVYPSVVVRKGRTVSNCVLVLMIFFKMRCSCSAPSHVQKHHFQLLPNREKNSPAYIQHVVWLGSSVLLSLTFDVFQVRAGICRGDGLSPSHLWHLPRYCSLWVVPLLACQKSWALSWSGLYKKSYIRGIITVLR